MNINLNIIIISILGLLSIMDNNNLQKLFNYKIITVIYLLGLCYIGSKHPTISLFMAILYLVVNNKKVTTENFQNKDDSEDSEDSEDDDDDHKEDSDDEDEGDEDDDDADNDDNDDKEDDSDDDSDDDNITETFTNGKKQYRLDNNLRKLNNAIKNLDY